MGRAHWDDLVAWDERVGMTSWHGTRAGDDQQISQRDIASFELDDRERVVLEQLPGR